MFHQLYLSASKQIFFLYFNSKFLNKFFFHFRLRDMPAMIDLRDETDDDDSEEDEDNDDDEDEEEEYEEDEDNEATEELDEEEETPNVR